MTTAVVRERIDNGAVAPTMILVVFLGFLLNLVDGFDVVAMSATAPSLIKEWGVTRAQLGPIFSSALIGMAIGAAVLAPYADRIGRRALVIFATVVIGVSMIAVGFIPKGDSAIPILIFIRFISGLGIGIIFASGAAIASEFMTEKYRNLAVVCTLMGYPFGAMVVGPTANFVIPTQGWEMLFIYGGVITLIMGVVIYLFLPESPEYLASAAYKKSNALERVNAVLRRLRREPLEVLPETSDDDQQKGGNVSSILTTELRLDTISLWTIYFMGFLTVYFLLSWIPTLFVDSGYTRAQGIHALTQFNFGALFGIFLIGLIATRIKIAKPIALFFFATALCLVGLYYWKPEALLTLNVMIFVIGFLLQGAFSAMYALAARVYPANVRATGIGWGAGLGRVGAILSPTIAGFLAGAGWSMYALYLVFAVPLVIAAVLVVRFKH